MAALTAWRGLARKFTVEGDLAGKMKLNGNVVEEEAGEMDGVDELRRKAVEVVGAIPNGWLR